MTYTKTETAAPKTAEDRARLEEALKWYCKFHLKDVDLDAVPELIKYIEQHD
jgi:hypothetical protein